MSAGRDRLIGGVAGALWHCIDNDTHLNRLTVDEYQDALVVLRDYIDRKLAEIERIENRS